MPVAFRSWVVLKKLNARKIKGRPLVSVDSLIRFHKIIPFSPLVVILLNQLVDVFAFVALGAKDLRCLLGDADADGEGAPRGGATSGKFVGAHSV